MNRSLYIKQLAQPQSQVKVFTMLHTGTGNTYGLDSSQAGIVYRLRTGATLQQQKTGTGTAFSFTRRMSHGTFVIMGVHPATGAEVQMKGGFIG